VIFVHYCVLHFAYCAVVIAEDFDVIILPIVLQLPTVFSIVTCCTGL